MYKIDQQITTESCLSFAVSNETRRLSDGKTYEMDLAFSSKEENETQRTTNTMRIAFLRIHFMRK